MSFTDLLIPLFFAGVLLYGLFNKVDVFAEFTEGVKEGLHTVLEIFPSLFCLVVTIAVFRASGGMTILAELLAPLFSAVGFPAECAPLVLLRPFSGSGAIALFENILGDVGADSFAGRVASVLLGSSETTFYTISVYFAATKVKKTRYALPAALCGDIAGFLLSALTVRLIFS
ncbi:MAG: spore maturation protein [Bacteroides sp.]|nr:spore maturation protein [Eubacterium sp.]MCM1418395.1 spore maturation protein [Roseburia sp.]MCM1462496.1 spore maturation protein [Bacteroides sp.]